MGTNQYIPTKRQRLKVNRAWVHNTGCTAYLELKRSLYLLPPLSPLPPPLSPSLSLLSPPPSLSISLSPSPSIPLPYALTLCQTPPLLQVGRLLQFPVSTEQPCWPVRQLILLTQLLEYLELRELKNMHIGYIIL